MAVSMLHLLQRVGGRFGNYSDATVAYRLSDCVK